MASLFPKGVSAQAGALAVAAAAGLIALFALFPPAIEAYRPDPHGRAVVDMAGRSVVIDAPVQRAMLFAPVAWHYLTVDGTDRHVSSVAGYMKAEAEATLLGRLFPTFAAREEARTQVGAVPLGVEQVLYERPDAVLVWAWFARDLEAVRYPGLVELASADGVDETALFRLLGTLTGKEGRVDTLRQRYERERARLLSAADLGADAPAEVMVIGASERSFWNGNARAFNAMLRSVGGRNVAEGITNNGFVTLEELLRLDPAVILLNSYYGSTMRPADIYADPALRNVRAVRERRVYRMPVGASRMAGLVEAPLMMAWTARLLHPSLQWEAPLRDAIRRTYKAVYGYEMTPKEIDAMLQVDANAVSAGYTVFLERE